MNNRITAKQQLFEYIVYKLNLWNRETSNGHNLQITKLRLQKILFLLCAVNATRQQKGLLAIFNNFAALPLGPVEIDIYDAMNQNQFPHLRFDGNDCLMNGLTAKVFAQINQVHKDLVDEAIISLKAKNRNYLTMPMFDLVDLTHQWSAWQTAKLVADIVGARRVKITTDEICNSLIKAF